MAGSKYWENFERVRVPLPENEVVELHRNTRVDNFDPYFEKQIQRRFVQDGRESTLGTFPWLRLYQAD